MIRRLCGVVLLFSFGVMMLAQDVVIIRHPAAAAAGPPAVTKVGSNTASTSTTFTVTLTAGIAIGGGSIVVVGQPYGATPITISVADARSNSYTCDRTWPATADLYTTICHARVGTALLTSDLVTITVGSYNYYLAGVYAASTMAASTPVDVYASNPNSYGTAVSTGTTGTATANDLCVAAATNDVPAGPIVSWSNGYAQLDDYAITSPSDLELMVGWKAITSGTTTTTTITVTTSGGIVGGVQCYKQ